jgi:hypothetical protein
MKNTSRTFETVSYNTLDINIDSITINNPYIDIKNKKIISAVNFNITGSNNQLEIIRSKTAVISDITEYDSIFDIDALFNKLETYYNIKPTISSIPKNYRIIYNPIDYVRKL